MELAENIMVIPAKKFIGTQKPTEKIRKKRVAAYCRVSTENEEQESSYELQVAHYTTYISGNPEWELVGIYADDGISGTNTSKRDAFNRMIEDCRAGKIDEIITKSISRFSRNTVDCLKYTRELKALNIAVFFEKERINTLDTKGEVMMTIMAALAQQESESLSANVRLGIQFRNQAGKVMVNHNRFLGYTKDEKGNLIINPDEAEVVKRIYAEYLDGKSLVQIKKGLEADGILNGAHNARWYASNIRQILTNEKYIGDALLQKTYTVSVLEKKRAPNKGHMPQYYVRRNHEPIIDEEIFKKVQLEIGRRKNIRTSGLRRNFSTKYALSGKVICGHCGEIFRRIKWDNRGRKSTVWRCLKRVEKKKYEDNCTARTIKEENLHTAVMKAINDLLSKKGAVIPVLRNNILDVCKTDLDLTIEKLDAAMQEKQKELLESSSDKERIEVIGNEINKLLEQKQDVKLKKARENEFRDRINEMIEFLDNQTEEITQYSEVLTRRLVERVIVQDKTMIIELRSGLTVEVNG